MTPGDTLIVASLAPPIDRQRRRIWMSAVAMIGAGTRPGTLTAPTTGRDGVVTLADLAPTILRRAGVPVPPSMSGHAMRARPTALALARVAAPGLEADLIHASVVRGRLMRGAVFGSCALVLVALLTVLAGRGTGGPARGLPRSWRAGVETALVAVCALPFSLFAEPLFHVRDGTLTAGAVAAVAVVVALTTRAFLGSRTAIAVVLAATVALVVGDLAERSPASFLVAEGARFRGIGNEMMGVIIAGLAIAGTTLLDLRPTGVARRVVPVVLILAVGVMAAPQLGAKFGSIPAAIPAFALIVLFAARIPVTVRSALAVAILTVLIADLAIVADALRNPEAQSHLARAVGGAGEIAGRKIGAAGRLLSASFWAVGVAVCGGAAGVLEWRRPALVARGLWGEPAVRRALACCSVAAVAAVATNDAGVVAAAWLAILAASSFFSRLLVPRD
jgi:hypothetical protein